MAKRNLNAPLPPQRWLRANGVELGALTGQDARALEAIAACWELYAGGDEEGCAVALLAVRDLLLAMQPQCRELTKKLIARSLDWSDVDRLWAKVTRVETQPRGYAGFEHACPRCQAKHVGEFDHCDACRETMALHNRCGITPRAVRS